MTNEKALIKVKGYLTDYLPLDCADEIDEIIKALEQQPKECRICIHSYPSDIDFENEIKRVLEQQPFEDYTSREREKIKEALEKMERGLQSCFNMVHCENNHDLLEGQERAFKYCIETLKEALDERKGRK